MGKLWLPKEPDVGDPMNRSVALSSSVAASTPTTSDDPPVRRPRRLRVGSALAAVIALVLIAYGTLWVVASLNLRDGVLNWVAAREAEGYRIDYATLNLGGFPLAARVTVLEPVVTAPAGRTLGWSWAGDRAALEVNPFRYNGLTLRLAGEEALSINIGGKLKTYRGGADEVTFRTIGRSSPRSGELTVRGLTMTADQPGDGIVLERLTASGTTREPVSAGSNVIELLAIQVDVGGVTLPQQLQLPLGNRIEQVTVDATIEGLSNDFTRPLDALGRWRDAGGVVDVARLGIHYGELKLSGVGTLSIDDALQPAGAFNARVEGFQQTITALTNRGFIEPKVATRARMATAVLSRRDGDGAPPSLQLPLTVRDRILSVGPLPLLKIPEIEWPRGPSPDQGGWPASADTVPG